MLRMQQVRLVCSDVRQFVPTEEDRADVIVAELVDAGVGARGGIRDVGDVELTDSFEYPLQGPGRGYHPLAQTRQSAAAELGCWSAACHPGCFDPQGCSTAAQASGCRARCPGELGLGWVSSRLVSGCWRLSLWFLNWLSFPGLPSMARDWMLHGRRFDGSKSIAE